MWIANPDNLQPELPTVWGVTPEALHRGDSEAVQVLQFLLSHHPQHYDFFVSFLATESVWGKRIPLVLKELISDEASYDPQEFFNLMIPGNLHDRIIELSEDDDWKQNWDSVY